MPKITPNITEKAKKIYDSLPETTNKSGWVSDAIVEKHNRDTGTDIYSKVAQLEQRVAELERKIGGK